MAQQFWRHCGALLLMGMLFGGGAAFAAENPLALPQAPDLDHFVFLPLIMRPVPPGIHGRVTYLSEPAAGVTVTLFLYDGGGRYPTPFRYTQTQADGGYHFTDVPALAPYTAYQVGYRNGWIGHPVNPEHLASWNMPSIPHYEAGESVSLAEFEVGDVRKLSPAAGVTVTFPVTFTWEPRSTAPQESYYCEVYMPGYLYGQGAVYWSLGSAEGTCVWSAPNAGFVYNDNYEWNIHVFWPDGSGGSGFGRLLHFSP